MIYFNGNITSCFPHLFPTRIFLVSSDFFTIVAVDVLSITPLRRRRPATTTSFTTPLVVPPPHMSIITIVIIIDRLLLSEISPSISPNWVG